MRRTIVVVLLFLMLTAIPAMAAVDPNEDIGSLAAFAEEWLETTEIVERELPTIPGKFLLEAETGDLRRALIHCYDAAGCLIDVEIAGHFTIKYTEIHKSNCDLNDDGIVNLYDFVLWAKDWRGEQ